MRITLRTIGLVIAAAAFPAAMHAQASQFGVRGLGMPGYETSVSAMGTGGSFSLFDELSATNPASIAGLQGLTASFGFMSNNVKQTNAAGTGTTRTTRFPGLLIGGPIPHSKFGVALSASTYLDRDFGLVTSDTITLRGTVQQFYDTLTALGGITDVQLGVSYRLGTTGAFGIGFHVLNGSTRTQLRRGFIDSSYTEVAQATTLSGRGAGISIGVVKAIFPTLAIAASARYDTHLSINRDSVLAYQVNLPLTFDAAIKYRPLRRLDFALRGQYRNWSTADAQLVAQGAPGAANTTIISFGGEYLTDFRRPYRKPIRFGGRYATLPFYLVRGAQGHEYAASLGTGTRFAGGRGGIDITAEHLWRADGTGRKESSFQISAGISIRP